MQLVDPKITSFWESQWQELASHEPFRSRAFDFFRSHGWPSAKAESWSNFSSAPLQTAYQRGAAAPTRGLEKFPAAGSPLVKTEALLLVVNGRVDERNSRLTGWDLTLESGKDFIWNDGIDALYQAFHQSSVHLRAHKSAPSLAIVHLQTKAGGFNPALIKLEIPAGVRTSVLECWPESEKSWTGGLCEVHLAAGASLEWVRWQSGLFRQMASQRFVLEKESRLDWIGVQSSCEWARTPVDVELREENAEAHLYGLSFGSRADETDQRMRICHLAPHTRSSQQFKSVLRDKAKNVFAGKIVIAKDAQKSDASQKHQSLNFHSTAQSITQPELEIDADDVKAAHGATVGRLDEDELFYLETRGIPRDLAMQLLARAFVEDVLSHMKNREFYHFVDQRLNSEIAAFLAALEQT